MGAPAGRQIVADRAILVETADELRGGGVRKRVACTWKEPTSFQNWKARQWLH
jgi:hypothetical protein